MYRDDAHDADTETIRNKWATTQALNKDMKIYIGGMGAATDTDTGYVDIEVLKDVVQRTREEYPSFGGVMLWDASQAYSKF